MSFLLLLIFFLLIIFLIISFTSFNQPYIPPPIKDCHQESKISFSLIFDISIGVYRSRVRLGDSKGYVDFSTIPDTGSSILIVAGPDCQQCNPEYGVWNYDLGTSVSDRRGVIKYGGGQKTIYLPWQAQLLNDDYDQEVNFGVITETFSPDGIPVNVLGLQYRRGSFLDGFCGQKTVIFDFPGEKLYLGKWKEILFNPHKQISTCSLSSPHFGPAYPLAKIESIAIDEKGKFKKLSVFPENAIIDTGTTNTIVSAEIAQELKEKKEVKIKFKKEKRKVDRYSSSVIFKIPPGSLVVGQRSYPSSMIIGNKWLSQYGVGLRYEQDQLVFFS